MKKKRKLSAREVAVLLRVRDQLLKLRRAASTPPELTVAEYRALDRTIMMMEVVR